MSGSVLTRRTALQLFAAQMAWALAGCSKPTEETFPYVRMPEGLVPGEPLRFATTLPLNGYGLGVVVTSIDGRPIKIEGNPQHPASLGATTPYLEAAVLSLYDPDRSQTVTERGSMTSRAAFDAALMRQMARHRADPGAALRLLTGQITSPTLLRQINLVLAQYPNARWHVHEAIGDGRRDGTELAYGPSLDVRPLIDKAQILVALDADLLGPGPAQIAHARQWAQRRKLGDDATFSRLHVAESALSLTGAKADHRVAVPPATISAIAVAIANALGANLPALSLPDEAAQFAARAAHDLQAHSGAAVVLGGRTQNAQTHALIHWINDRIKAPRSFAKPVLATDKAGTLNELIGDIEAGKVETLLVLDANPVYDGSTRQPVEAAFRKVPFSIHQGLYKDETAAACRWHVPLSHPLESWSDSRAFNGTASLVQPLINPLYATSTAHELLAYVVGRSNATAHDLVRETWNETWSQTSNALPAAESQTDAFETWWRQALHDGVIAAVAETAPAAPAAQLPQPSPTKASTDGFVLVLTPDPSVWDGRFANNPWLQECPRPLGKEVWGNALTLHPDDARQWHLEGGDIVSLTANGHTVETPVRVEPAAAQGVAAMTLGYGRRAAGQIGNGVGTDAYPLRDSADSWTINDCTLVKTGRRRPVLTTQNDVRLEGETRDLYHLLTLAAAHASNDEKRSPTPDPATLMPPHTYDTWSWGMVIDTSVCIGCNACVVSCQAENNIPVVGPEEIARGRDMHWLRVDAYQQDAASESAIGFQPVPCMQCEHAPCEPVCPVAASVHDGEGLNAQVYNRCVGTRFCEANCPYKVRRFNFFGYADGQEYANLGADSIRAQHNPDVTVRQRGVMEKCTYCVQRISRARIDAEKSDRPIGPDEVVTACQSACPTKAITFGNINDAAAQVTRQKSAPHHYALLGHLGTRPRTTYLADIRNPVTAADGEHE